MELLGFNIIFFKKIQEFKPAYPPTSLPPPTYTHKINFSVHPEKILIFQEKENLKKLVFSQKKAVLILWKTETSKNYLYFRKQNPPKLLIFQEVTFQAQKLKSTPLKSFFFFRKWNFLVFQEMEHFSYFRR